MFFQFFQLVDFPHHVITNRWIVVEVFHTLTSSSKCFFSIVNHFDKTINNSKALCHSGVFLWLVRWVFCHPSEKYSQPSNWIISLRFGVKIQENLWNHHRGVSENYHYHYHNHQKKTKIIHPRNLTAKAPETWIIWKTFSFPFGKLGLFLGANLLLVGLRWFMSPLLALMVGCFNPSEKMQTVKLDHFPQNKGAKISKKSLKPPVT